MSVEATETTAPVYDLPDAWKGSAFLGGLRLACFVVMVMGLFAFYHGILLPFKLNRYTMCRRFHALFLKLLNVKLRVHGAPTDGQIMFVSNHTCPFDIPVIGSICTASFVAKSEMNGWPVINHMCDMQETIFIVRRAGHLREQQNDLQNAIDAGRSLIMFPEGTTGLGTDALPFNSSLFSIPMTPDNAKRLKVQPMVVTITEIAGIPVTPERREFCAWYRPEDDLANYAWKVMKVPSLTIDVTFFPAVDPRDYADRKALSRAMYDQIAGCIRQLNAEAVQKDSERKRIA
ncbi:MAG: 1-acyl-sn-glycerol-3-phosphate acyltransferase [Alphaproteobacteria bacterium]|nr:1-acyl-sn-glycerol-3-phosphate acyltransferase [Alphaproteobacteria bacterium]MBV8549386.1 1-acyl-sn-glycerol-3-phosphate acyltransferase [Alphaproteobacteria bacterium]